MAVIAPINAQTFPIGSFLTNNSCAIPDLQRPYAWSEEQANELIYDLKRIITSTVDDNVPQHFFGTIVLLSSNGLRLDIIDGQQRLTTVSLLLGLIQTSIVKVSELAKKKGGANGAQVAANALQIADGITPLLRFQGAMDNAGKIQEELRMLVSPEIRLTFESLLSGGDGDIPSEDNGPADNLRRIARIFVKDLIEEKGKFQGEPLDRLRHLKKVHDAVRQGLLVVSLQTSSSDAGYDLFESLNARGLELNTLDLIKVWMLNKLSGEDSSAVAKSMRNMASDDIKAQLAFFEDFYRARAQRNTNQKKGKALALLAREHVFKDPMFVDDNFNTTLSQRIHSEVSLMEKWTPIWESVSKARIPATVKGSVPELSWAGHRFSLLSANLRHTGVVTPLMMVACDTLETNPAKLAEFIHTIERFFFRFKVMCGGPVKEIEQAYYKFIQAMTTNNDIDLNMVNTTLQGLIDLYADDEKFDARIRERLNYSLGAQAREKIAYFLWTVECYSYANKGPKKNVQSLSDWHLEHIYPQNPQANAPQLGPIVDQIGNICLLDPKINKQLSNLDFSAKRAKVADIMSRNNGQLDIVEGRKVFVDPQVSWDDNDIEARNVRLITLAKTIFKFS